MPAAILTMRQLRFARKITLRQLQQLTGINRGTLSQIERGRIVGSPDELARISEAIGTDPLEIRTIPVLEADL